MGPKKTKSTPRILSRGRGRAVPSAAASGSSTAQTASRNVVPPVIDLHGPPQPPFVPPTPAFRAASQVNRPTVYVYQPGVSQNVRPSFPGTGINSSSIRQPVPLSQKNKKASVRGRGRGKQMTSKESFQQQLLAQEREKRLLQQQRKLETVQMGSFFLWLSENRNKLEEENPELVGSYLVIKAGQVWRNLTPAERFVHDSKLRTTPPAYIASLIELGREDFDEEFQDAKSIYDAFFPAETPIKVEIPIKVEPAQNMPDSK